jgi:hypothetical protein
MAPRTAPQPDRTPSETWTRPVLGTVAHNEFRVRHLPRLPSQRARTVIPHVAQQGRDRGADRSVALRRRRLDVPGLHQANPRTRLGSSGVALGDARTPAGMDRHWPKIWSAHDPHPPTRRHFPRLHGRAGPVLPPRLLEATAVDPLSRAGALVRTMDGRQEPRTPGVGLPGARRSARGSQASGLTPRSSGQRSLCSVCCQPCSWANDRTRASRDCLEPPPWSIGMLICRPHTSHTITLPLMVTYPGLLRRGCVSSNPGGGCAARPEHGVLPARAPGTIRTRNLMGRNHLLYPVELQGQCIPAWHTTLRP